MWIDILVWRGEARIFFPINLLFLDS